MNNTIPIELHARKSGSFVDPRMPDYRGSIVVELIIGKFQNFESILNHYFIHVRTIRILLTNISSIEEEILSYYNDNIMAVITVQQSCCDKLDIYGTWNYRSCQISYTCTC